jgi:16S rRNA (cytidine1402-2'-O)-methyltransferase
MKIVRPALYLVGTPIGNLDDMSPRAVEILSECDFVAAEDTRVSSKLLSAFDIRKPMISYYEHNIRERGEEIIARLLGGESCALITDAGTPAISDPGEDLVRLCAENGVTVTAIPGACAMVNALALSALSTVRFVFEGFLPVQKKQRKERLKELSGEQRTFILHEAPHKLRATLSDLSEVLGADRKIALCRELTKLNEEIIRTTLKDACAIYEEREPRGEYVLVIEGKKACEREDTEEISVDALREEVNLRISGGMGKNSEIKAVAEAHGMTRNGLYDLLLEK